MLEIKKYMEAVAGRLDSGLLRKYRDGEVELGWHRDAGNPEVIASLSFGAQRAMCVGLRTGKKTEEIWRMFLPHGSLLLIPQSVNAALVHRILPDRRIKEPRI
ncbi:MAG TPA: alpha-ketoglutarate-dependent dioxygenase AlkB, partial [Terriglobales bacterium]|nr:alpha-ketoglutarate-dependent dioxygenase AlkB [Terriglobales bacterium]